MIKFARARYTKQLEYYSWLGSELRRPAKQSHAFKLHAVNWDVLSWKMCQLLWSKRGRLDPKAILQRKNKIKARILTCAGWLSVQKRCLPDVPSSADLLSSGPDMAFVGNAGLRRSSSDTATKISLTPLLRLVH